MGLAARLTDNYLETRAKKWGPVSPKSPPDWLLEILGWPTRAKTTSGATVNHNTAITASAVFACVRLISETLASTPTPFYRRLDGGGKERFIDHPNYKLLHDEPNPEMTPYQFKEALTGHMALWGNCYAEIQREQYSGRAVALWPLRPDCMAVMRDKEMNLYYRYTMPDGGEVALLPDNILHVPWFGNDGIVGYSPIDLARDSIGLTMAMEEYGARFFANDANPGGLLKHKTRLSPTAKEALRKDVEKRRELSQKHRLLILEEGMEWQQIGIPPETAQFLEGRKFQVIEVARWFNVPPHKIQDLDNATYSNIEHQSIEFIRDTMRPWYVRWEQGLGKKLIAPQDRSNLFFEFLIDSLLRGDIKTRYEAYAIGRQWGWLNVDQILEMENKNPLPDGAGQTYLDPLNMKEAGENTPPPKEEDKERVLTPFFNDAVQRIEARENRDGKKLDHAKHGEFIRKVMGPFSEAYQNLTGSPFDIDDFVNRRLTELGG